jgi:hypothetical protein
VTWDYPSSQVESVTCIIFVVDLPVLSSYTPATKKEVLINSIKINYFQEECDVPINQAG